MKTLHATQSTVRIDGAFWLRWVLANALALTISVVVSAYVYPVVNAALGSTLGRTTVATTVSVLSLLSGILIAILVGMRHRKFPCAIRRFRHIGRASGNTFIQWRDPDDDHGCGQDISVVGLAQVRVPGRLVGGD